MYYTWFCCTSSIICDNAIVQDMRQCEDGSGFTTAEDDQGKAILLAIQEDKRKRLVLC